MSVRVTASDSHAQTTARSWPRHSNALSVPSETGIRYQFLLAPRQNSSPHGGQQPPAALMENKGEMVQQTQSQYDGQQGSPQRILSLFSFLFSFFCLI